MLKEKIPYGEWLKKSNRTSLSPLSPSLPHGGAASVASPEVANRFKEELAINPTDLRGELIRQIELRRKFGISYAQAKKRKMAAQALYEKNQADMKRELSKIRATVLRTYLAMPEQQSRRVLLDEQRAATEGNPIYQSTLVEWENRLKLLQDNVIEAQYEEDLFGVAYFCTIQRGEIVIQMWRTDFQSSRDEYKEIMGEMIALEQRRRE